VRLGTDSGMSRGRRTWIRLVLLLLLLVIELIHVIFLVSTKQIGCLGCNRVCSAYSSHSNSRGRICIGVVVHHVTRLLGHLVEMVR